MAVSDVDAAVDALDIGTSGGAASGGGTHPGAGSSHPATADDVGCDSKTALDDFLDSAADARATNFTRSLPAQRSGRGCITLQGPSSVQAGV